MELNYKNMYEYEYQKYQTLLKNYQNALSNPKYIKAYYNSVFDFLKMDYFCKRINLYLSFSKENRPIFKFNSLQDAISTYTDLINFNKNSNEILDKIALITYIKNIKNNINLLITKSDYLPNELLLDGNSKVEELASECLQNIPNIKINNELRNDILVDIANQFDNKQITQLTKIHMFKPTDIDMLANRLVSAKGKENLKAICLFYNMEITPIKSLDIKIKGVTFKNDDGSSRQDYLKELNDKIKNNVTISGLTLEPFTYKPEIGKEEPAVKVLWGDKQLGFLPKDVVFDLNNTYKDKLITARIKNISGGDKVPFGLEIIMDVCEKNILNEKSKEIEDDLEM